MATAERTVKAKSEINSISYLRTDFSGLLDMTSCFGLLAFSTDFFRVEGFVVLEAFFVPDTAVLAPELAFLVFVEAGFCEVPTWTPPFLIR
jgi:hypothetical protein